MENIFLSHQALTLTGIVSTTGIIGTRLAMHSKTYSNHRAYRKMADIALKQSKRPEPMYLALSRWGWQCVNITSRTPLKGVVAVAAACYYWGLWKNNS